MENFEEILATVVTVIITAAVKWGKDYLDKKSKAEEYEKYNQKTERILDNAVSHAKLMSAKDESKDKVSIAMDYIKVMGEDVFSKEGPEKLKMMIERKAVQLGLDW